MPEEEKAIDVEVVEIDGVPPAPPAASYPYESERAGARRSREDWRQWQGRVRQLDMRWWPLWLFLGIIALFLILTVGVAAAILMIIFRIIRGILRAILG